jgi:hypothetical protein
MMSEIGYPEAAQNEETESAAMQAARQRAFELFGPSYDFIERQVDDGQGGTKAEVVMMRGEYDYVFDDELGQFRQALFAGMRYVGLSAPLQSRQEFNEIDGRT